KLLILDRYLSRGYPLHFPHQHTATLALFSSFPYVK
ncbi:hypothetical protein CP061683_0470, partial [Chlamydia psittaci 06-1683]